MNSLADLPADAPDWFVTHDPLTDEQLDAMAAEYQREQIESAQSEAAFEANKQEYK